MSGVPEQPPHTPIAEPSAPPERDQVCCVLCKPATILVGVEDLKKYN